MLFVCAFVLKNEEKIKKNIILTSMLCIAISIDFKIVLHIFDVDSEEKSDLKKPV